MGRIFDKTVKQDNGVTHGFQKEFSQVESEKQKKNKSQCTIADDILPGIFSPGTVVLDLQNQIFGTEKIDIEAFYKMDVVIFNVDLFIKVYMLILKQRKDLFIVDVINGRLETFISGVAFPLFKIVVKHLESFGLDVGIFGKSCTLLRQKKFLLCLIVEECGEHNQNAHQCYVECQKPVKGFLLTFEY